MYHDLWIKAMLHKGDRVPTHEHDTANVSMTVELTPELEEFVNAEIERGDYKSADEVVREGLRLLRLRREKIEALRREIKLGIDAIEQGRFREYTSVEEFSKTLKPLWQNTGNRGRVSEVALGLALCGNGGS